MSSIGAVVAVVAASRQIEITEPTVVSVDGPNFLRKTAVA